MHDSDILDSYPLTSLQEGMLFDHEFAPGSGANIVQIVCVLREHLDPALLEKAWRSVIDRNPVLRTSFHRSGGGAPVQRVHRSVDAGILLCDRGMKSPAEGSGLFDARLDEDRRRGFDPVSPPLIRLALFAMGTDASILVVSLHHILLDGHAFPLLLDGLFSRYESLAAERAPVCEEPVPFRAYIDSVHRENHGRSEVFWKDYLRGFTDPTPLPPEPGPCSPGGAFLEFGRCDLHLLPPVLSGLRELAAASGARLSTVFHAAWGLLLSRNSGDTDVVFGETRACRRSTVNGAERILGCCINTLPLRIRVPPEALLVDLLRQLRRDHSAVREHEQTPLGQIRTWSQVTGGRPLFETLLVYDHVGLTALMRSRGAGGREREFSVLSHTHFPLVFEIQGEEGMLRLTYSRSRFTPSTAERMLGHLETILTSMAARGDQRVGEIPLLTEREKRRILIEWNATGVSGGPPLCVHELIEAQTELTPDAVAVSCGRDAWTYRDLNHRANLFARRMSALGVGPEVVVGIALERSCEMMMCLLGILKAGGAYLPLDPSLPEERRRFVLEDARPSYIVTSRDRSGFFGMMDVPLVFPEEIPGVDPAGEALTETNFPGRAGPGNAAYVIYTSGSTGRPKGTVVLHRGLSNYLLWCTAAYDVRRGGGSLVHTPLAFDLTVTGLYSPLLCGGTVYLLPESSPPEDLCAALLEHAEPCLVKITPAHLELLATLISPGAGASLTAAFVIGGEDLKADLAARWQKIAPGALLFNEYGPTETVVGCSVFRIPPGVLAAGSIPIGRPIANTQMYILDRTMHPVPVGVTGELYIGGAGVARGYLNRPALTAERFVVDPFSGDPSSRLYRTGDLGRYLPDGVIEYVGRTDYQVKIRGYRIELGEIEMALRSHERVREAVVEVQEEGGDKRLVAYYVAGGGEDLPAGELRSYLRERLPEYMVPAGYVAMEGMPLTANGKVDRKALKEVAWRGGSEVGRRLPEGPVEERLAEIWREVLGVREIGVEDNFFDVGGHSLLAFQVVAKSNEEWGLKISLLDLFERPTIRQLKALVESGSGSEADRVPGVRESPVPIVKRSEKAGPARLSYGQERLWFLDRMEGGKATYNVPYVYTLEGDLSLEVLERSLREVVRRHEILRTRIEVARGTPVQVVGDAAWVNLEVEDVSALGEKDREEALRRLVKEEAHRAFDLERGPLMRSRVVRCGERLHMLLLTFHHIVFDGWSDGIFFGELSKLYAAYVQGKGTPLEDVPVQYGDYAEWQRAWLEGGVLEKQLSYWKEKLGGDLPVLALPADRARPKIRTNRGITESFELPEPLCRKLEDLSQRESATMFMTLLSAFEVLMLRYSGQEELLVGTPIAGRRRMEVEKLIGFFVNTLVLRTDLGGDPTFRDLLGRVRGVCLGAFEHRDVPFEKLVEELHPARNVSHSPLFQAMFVLQAEEEAAIALGDCKGHRLDVNTETAKFDVMLSLTKRQNRLAGSLQCDADLFDRDSVLRMIEHFTTLLEGIAADPREHVWQIPIMTEVEAQKVTVEWNGTQTGYPSGSSIHGLFETQVRQVPEAVALQDGIHQVTYRDLNSRANRLARFLRARGVGPESSVGVVLDRSVDLIVGLLAILKAGGTYVPLEISQPRERVSFILDDARVGIILSHRSHKDEIPPRAGEVIFLDLEWHDIGRESEEDLPVAVSPDALAYVMYTSGSTGAPKGVCVRHRGVVRLVRSNDYAALNSGEVFLLFSSISFDASTFEIWGSLLNGARLVIFPPHIPSLEELGRVVRDTGVTTLWLTASLFHHMVDGPLDLLGGVRQMLTGGEVLPVPQVRRFLERYPRCRLINGYGPTENTTFTCCYTVGAGTGITTSVPIGRPIRNTRVYILDRFMQPLPVGIPGELFAAGDGLARGYLNRPDLTAEKFVAGPAGSGSPERLYRTGDLARYLPDGNIEFIGRVDNQVKIRGFRIELEEIEGVLVRCPGVREAAVTVTEVAPGDRRLFAHCAVDGGSPGRAGALRDSLKLKLPEYMIPSAFVFLDALPRNPNGKVDRVLLSASAPAGTVDRGGATGEEMSPTEDALAGILARILGVARVGINDNFFSLGGHSLLAMQVVSRIRDRWRIDLSLVSVFEYPTVGELALAIEEKLLDQIENLRDEEV